LVFLGATLLGATTLQAKQETIRAAQEYRRQLDRGQAPSPSGYILSLCVTLKMNLFAIVL